MSSDSVLVSAAEGLGRLFYIVNPYKVELLYKIISEIF